MVVATYVDPGQHNFLSPLGHHLTHILQHLIGRATDSPSAHKGNDAKSTEIVAAVLYFHQTARMKHFGEGLVAEQVKIFIGKHRVTRLQQGIHTLKNTALRLVIDDRSPRKLLVQLIGVTLGHTTRNHHLRLRIYLSGVTDHVTRFLIALIGYRTGIHHHHIGTLFLL